jgi:hypothetical protein
MKSGLEITIRIVVSSPPAGVDLGLQYGKGADYTTMQTQRSTGADLRFEFPVTVARMADGVTPNFLGPFAQGPVAGRFVYLDVGTCAGQVDSEWSRRIKVPLAGITADLIDDMTKRKGRLLEATIPGTAKDGGPSCATVKPVCGWAVAKA